MFDCYTPARNGLLGVADWVTATCTNGSRAQVLAIAGCAVATVATINYIWGPAPWFGPFYMVIICLLTWAFGARIGVLVGFGCMGLGLTLNGFSLYTSDRFTVGWTVGTRAATVILVIALVALFRRSYLREWTRARTDYLTGALTKRAYLEDRATRTSKTSWRVLAYLDLDKFKEVNDTRGHAEGDAVLSLFANNLRGCIRGSDALVRLGGDEFLLDIWAKNEADARAAMKSIHSRLIEALRVNGHDLGCSVGAVLIPPRARPIAEAEISLADQLMYQAKRERLPEPLLAIHLNGGELTRAKDRPAMLEPERRAA